MRIDSKGIVISEIFKHDEGEKIEITPDGQDVIMTLYSEDGAGVYRYSAEAFRQLLSAMNSADMEIRQIERSPLCMDDEVEPLDSDGDWRQGR